MQIHYLNPNIISTQVEDVFNVTDKVGKKLIEELKLTIENLKNHWEGSDAVTNLTILENVYERLVNMLIDLQSFIVSINNLELTKMQKIIVRNGDECNIGKSLSRTIYCDLTIPIPTEKVKTVTKDEIIDDITSFSGFSNRIRDFSNIINEKKDTLLGNWLDSENRGHVISTFDKFNNEINEYIDDVIKVEKNLNIILENKKKILNK